MGLGKLRVSLEILRELLKLPKDFQLRDASVEPRWWEDGKPMDLVFLVEHDAIPQARSRGQAPEIHVTYRSNPDKPVPETELLSIVLGDPGLGEVLYPERKPIPPCLCGHAYEEHEGEGGEHHGQFCKSRGCECQDYDAVPPAST